MYSLVLTFRCGSQCGAQTLSVDLKCLECVLWLWALAVAWAMDYDFNSEVWVSDLLQGRVDFQCTFSFLYLGVDFKCGARTFSVDLKCSGCVLCLWVLFSCGSSSGL